MNHDRNHENGFADESDLPEYEGNPEFELLDPARQDLITERFDRGIALRDARDRVVREQLIAAGVDARDRYVKWLLNRPAPVAVQQAKRRRDRGRS